MGFALRDATSAPSLAGFAAATWASLLLPAAIPGAVFAGLFISDPGQIWHVGDRHNLVKKTTDRGKTELHTSTSDTDGFKTPAARAKFDQRMDGFTKALGDTSDQHGMLEIMMKVGAGVTQALGAAALTVGLALLEVAKAVVAAAAVPGANLGIYGGANASAGRMSLILRDMAKPFIRLIAKITNLLKPILSMSLKRKLAIAGLGAFGYTTLKTPAANMVAGVLPLPNKKVEWPKSESI